MERKIYMDLYVFIMGKANELRVKILINFSSQSQVIKKQKSQLV